MRVIVIGAGLAGMTAAYFLRRRGHEVVVVEREEGPGRQTSFANGGLLTPSMPEPWNAPGCWRVLLSSCVRSDAALKLRLSALPALAHWGVRFLRNSNRVRYERNTLSNLTLAFHSLTQGDGLIATGHGPRVRLHYIRDLEALPEACRVGSGDRSGESIVIGRIEFPQTFDTRDHRT